MSEEKIDLHNECYHCKHVREVPGDAHIRCAKPDPDMTGEPRAEARGWFFYPLCFDPTWKTKTCCNFEAKVIRGKLSDDGLFDRIIVRVENKLLGDSVFWEGDSRDIEQINNLLARIMAQGVIADGKTRRDGYWVVSLVDPTKRKTTMGLYPCNKVREAAENNERFRKGRMK